MKRRRRRPRRRTSPASPSRPRRPQARHRPRRPRLRQKAGWRSQGRDADAVAPPAGHAGRSTPTTAAPSPRPNPTPPSRAQPSSVPRPSSCSSETASDGGRAAKPCFGGMARATGLEPATSGVTGRDNPSQINTCGYLLRARTGLRAAKVSAWAWTRSAHQEPLISCRKTSGPTLRGVGPDVVSFVAFVSRLVATKQTATRDGMTMRPDTAKAQYGASPITLHQGGIGDENIRYH